MDDVRRIDLLDGRSYTRDEVAGFYCKWHNKAESDFYWRHQCLPLPVSRRMRIDPIDGQRYSYTQIAKFYEGWLSQKAISEYWEHCIPPQRRWRRREAQCSTRKDATEDRQSDYGETHAEDRQSYNEPDEDWSMSLREAFAIAKDCCFRKQECWLWMSQFQDSVHEKQWRRDACAEDRSLWCCLVLDLIGGYGSEQHRALWSESQSAAFSNETDTLAHSQDNSSVTKCWTCRHVFVDFCWNAGRKPNVTERSLQQKGQALPTTAIAAC